MGYGAILWNGCEIQGKNNVALLQESEMTAGFYSKNWMYIYVYIYVYNVLGLPC